MMFLCYSIKVASNNIVASLLLNLTFMWRAGQYLRFHVEGGLTSKMYLLDDFHVRLFIEGIEALSMATSAIIIHLRLILYGIHLACLP